MSNHPRKSTNQELCTNHNFVESSSTAMSSSSPFQTFLIFVGLLSMMEGQTLKDEKAIRDSKVFSIFSIVQFKNTGCTSSMTLSSSSGNTYRNGTCLTNAECGEKGGSSSGSCAGG